MKMDRNLNADGRGKYALLNLRRVSENGAPEVREALDVLTEAGVLEWGFVGDQDEFFVMKLKDINAPGGLVGYAESAAKSDPEWAGEVRSMVARAGINSPFCKVPD